MILTVKTCGFFFEADLSMISGIPYILAYKYGSPISRLPFSSFNLKILLLTPL